MIRSERLKRWQEYFGQVARMCAQKVRQMGLPKGERLEALRRCVSEHTKGKSAEVV